MAKPVEKNRSPSRRDVELAQAHAEISKARATVEKWRHLGGALQFGVAIVSSAVPIWALSFVLEPFAGNTTEIRANIVVSVSIVATLTIGGAALVKIMRQRREIKRMRERLDALESGRL